MATSQRLSRGFHRLAIFLAAIPLVVGGAWSFTVALGEASSAKARHEQLVCAQTKLRNNSRAFARLGGHDDFDAAGAQPPANTPGRLRLIPDEEVGLPLSLKQVGCSDSDYDTVTYKEARNPPAFNWLATFGSAMLPSMPITLALSLAVYGIVRAIGWVIGGFAAS